MDDRLCAYCGEPFTPKVYNQKYCCTQHTAKHSNERRYKSRYSETGVGASIASLDDRELAAELSRRGYSVEIEKLAEAEDRRFEVKIKRFQGDYFKVGCISCSHLGSRYQQLTALREFYRYCAINEIDTVLHTGDAIDGDGTVYDGQIYEMFLQGADPQMEYMIENYPQEEGVNTYIIGGNHDNSFIKSSNANVLDKVSKAREDINYLGEYGAFFKIKGTEIDFYLMHGGGRSNPYARSYRMQKVIENFTPENKPHILLLGHWHVNCHIPQYRNVEGFLMGAFQSQTPHLKRLGIWPSTTAQILEIYPDDKGIAKIKTEWLHWHIVGERDY
jgi:predicted phosphodiesterase